jgi:hypothetical protein
MDWGQKWPIEEAAIATLHYGCHGLKLLRETAYLALQFCHL